MFLLTIMEFNLPFLFETLILGIVASLFVAIVVEWWKKRRKRFHVSVTLDSQEVYASQDRSDVKIKVDYKEKEVENALVIMHVRITNDGQNDIMFKTHFSDAILIECEGYDFLSISAEDSRVAPECVLNTDGTASLSWDILKSGEVIRLCIAAHSVTLLKDGLDGAECFNKLSFDFRSDCIDALTLTKELTQREINRRYALNGNVLKNVLMIALSLGTLLFEMSFSSRFDMVYDGQSYENATLLYSPLFQKYILSSDTARTKVLSRADILDVKSVIPSDAIITANWISAVLEVMVLLMIVVSVVSIVSSSVIYSRGRRGRISRRNHKSAGAEW